MLWEPISLYIIFSFCTIVLGQRKFISEIPLQTATHIFFYVANFQLYSLLVVLTILFAVIQLRRWLDTFLFSLFITASLCRRYSLVIYPSLYCTFGFNLYIPHDRLFTTLNSLKHFLSLSCTYHYISSSSTSIRTSNLSMHPLNSSVCISLTCRYSVYFSLY